MTDDDILLASAYLDDDLDDAERAHAEADPNVMAEVSRLRDVRAQLRDVEPPAAGQRDRAIAAALAASTDDAAPMAPPVPLHGRSRRPWWGAAAAAAALVVVVAGGVALQGNGDDDDESASDLAPAAATEAASETRVAAATGAASDETEAAADAASGAETTAATAATSAATAGTTGAAPAALPPPDLKTPADLSAFAADSVLSETGAAAAPVCEQAGEYLGPATVDGRPVEVFTTASQVTAVDVATCQAVLSVSR